MFTLGQSISIKPRIYLRDSREGDVSWKQELLKDREKIEKENAKQWWMSILSNVSTQNSRVNTDAALKKEIDALTIRWINVNQWPYRVVINEYILFLKDIFDAQGKRKESADRTIANLGKALWMEEKTTPQDMEKKQKEADVFVKEFPFDTFKTTIYSQAVEHPIRSRTWIILNDFDTLKKRVEKLWSTLPPEYKTVIGTVENIMQSQEFKENTGNIETFFRKKLWQGKTVADFQSNMRTFLDIAGKQKRTLTMKDFENQFNQNRELSEGEMRDLTVYMTSIRNSINKEKGKAQQLALIDEIIKDPKIDNKPKAFISRVQGFLAVERSNIERSSNTETLTGMAWNALRIVVGSERTEENEKKAKQEADELGKDGIPRIVSFDNKKDRFVIYSMKEIYRVKINIGVNFNHF